MVVSNGPAPITNDNNTPHLWCSNRLPLHHWSRSPRYMALETFHPGGQPVWKRGDAVVNSPIPSMGLVYLPTFTIKNQPNVGKYTIHGSYGSGWRVIRGTSQWIWRVILLMDVDGILNQFIFFCRVLIHVRCCRISWRATVLINYQSLTELYILKIYKATSRYHLKSYHPYLLYFYNLDFQIRSLVMCYLSSEVCWCLNPKCFIAWNIYLHVGWNLW